MQGSGGDYDRPDTRWGQARERRHQSPGDRVDDTDEREADQAVRNRVRQRIPCRVSNAEKSTANMIDNDTHTRSSTRTL
jgi:hypothetical protein